jgi:phospholipase/lecithinase/hemolysin
VVNSPDIGSIPETGIAAIEENNKHLARQTKRRSRQFNRKLARKIWRIEYDTSLDLVLFDIFDYLQKVLRNSTALGYENTTDACFSTVMGQFNPECEFGQRFPEFLFFDEIHPTGRSHERVSRAMFAEVPEG